MRRDFQRGEGETKKQFPAFFASVSLFAGLPISLFTCQSVYLSVCLSALLTFLPTYLSCPCIILSLCLYFLPSKTTGRKRSREVGKQDKTKIDIDRQTDRHADRKIHNRWKEITCLSIEWRKNNDLKWLFVQRVENWKSAKIGQNMLV